VFKPLFSLTGNVVLRNNSFTGPVPNVFASFTRIQFFDLRNNFFSGPLPSTVFDVQTLRIAYFSNNNFNGTIPSNYGGPPRLRDLWLDGNMLNGPIPEVEGNQLRELSEFTLQNNNFTGDMPDSICNLRSSPNVLRELWVDCGGPTPEVICEFRECCTRCFA
jgi:hypothetical protein